MGWVGFREGHNRFDPSQWACKLKLEVSLKKSEPHLIGLQLILTANYGQFWLPTTGDSDNQQQRILTANYGGFWLPTMVDSDCQVLPILIANNGWFWLPTAASNSSNIIKTIWRCHMVTLLSNIATLLGDAATSLRVWRHWCCDITDSEMSLSIQRFSWVTLITYWCVRVCLENVKI